MTKIILDDEEKDRIKRIFSHIEKNPKKYQSQINLCKKFYPRTESNKFSFRVASKKDYRYKIKNESQFTRFNFIRNHNARIKHQTNLEKNLGDNYADYQEPNEYKEYITNLSEIYDTNSKTTLTKKEIKYELKKLYLQQKRLSNKKIQYKKEKLHLINELQDLMKQQDNYYKFINDRFTTKQENLESLEILKKPTKESFDKVINRIKYLNNKYLENIDKLKTIMQQIKQLESELNKPQNKARSNAELFKEVVMNVKKEHTIQDIEKALESLKKQIPTLQKANILSIAIHRDEGHINKLSGEIIKNYHAHIVFNNIDKETNKTIFRNLSRTDLINIQDILAKELGMQRGERGSNQKHQTKQQREYNTQIALKTFIKILPELEKEMQKDIKAEQELEKYPKFQEYKSLETQNQEPKQTNIENYHKLLNKVYYESYKYNGGNENRERLEKYIISFIEWCSKNKKIEINNRLSKVPYEQITINSNMIHVWSRDNSEENINKLKEFSNNREKYFNEFAEQNKEVANFIIEISKKYLQIATQKKQDEIQSAIPNIKELETLNEFLNNPFKTYKRKELRENTDENAEKQSFQEKIDIQTNEAVNNPAQTIENAIISMHKKYLQYKAKSAKYLYTSTYHKEATSQAFKMRNYFKKQDKELKNEILQNAEIAQIIKEIEIYCKKVELEKSNNKGFSR